MDLEALEQLPVAEHVARFEAIHQELVARLNAPVPVDGPIQVAAATGSVGSVDGVSEGIQA